MMGILKETTPMHDKGMMNILENISLCVNIFLYFLFGYFQLWKSLDSVQFTWVLSSSQINLTIGTFAYFSYPYIVFDCFCVEVVKEVLVVAYASLCHSFHVLETISLYFWTYQGIVFFHRLVGLRAMQGYQLQDVLNMICSWFDLDGCTISPGNHAMIVETFVI